MTRVEIISEFLMDHLYVLSLRVIT